jgi:hypothetical protein
LLLHFVASHTTNTYKKKLRGKQGGYQKGGGFQGGLNRSLKKITEFCKQDDIKKVLRDLLPTAERSHGNRLMMSTTEF